MRMKFYCSTKKVEGKHEAHAIATKLEGATFLFLARLSDEDQDDPDKVKAALKKEFDKEAVDHELRSLNRKMAKLQHNWRGELRNLWAKRIQNYAAQKTRQQRKCIFKCYKTHNR